MDRPQRFVWNKLISGALPRRRLAAARHPGPGQGPAGSSRRSSRTGSWATGSRPRPSSSRCTRRDVGRRRHQPALSRSSWPMPLEDAPETLGDPARLAGRVEVGRHPLAAHPARRADLPLVARRGAGHRPLSRAGRRRRRCSPRGPSLDGEILPWKDGAPPALRAAAAADRPQDGRQDDPRRGPRRPGGLRPARRRRGSTSALATWPGDAPGWRRSPRRSTGPAGSSSRPSSQATTRGRSWPRSARRAASAGPRG